MLLISIVAILNFTAPPPAASTRGVILQRIRWLADSWFGAVLGAAAYGAWAVWANWSEGPMQAFRIGCAHWLASAFLTYCGTYVMRQLFGQRNTVVAGVRSIGGGLLFTYGILLLVHTLVNTQHILLTLAPGLVPNVLFCVGYTALLSRTQTNIPKR